MTNVQIIPTPLNRTPTPDRSPGGIGRYETSESGSSRAWIWPNPEHYSTYKYRLISTCNIHVHTHTLTHTHTGHALLRTGVKPDRLTADLFLDYIFPWFHSPTLKIHSQLNARSQQRGPPLYQYLPTKKGALGWQNVGTKKGMFLI